MINYLSRAEDKNFLDNLPEKIELEVYNNTLEPQGIITDKFSFRWVRKYFTSGTFELQCALNPNNFELLKKGNILSRLDAVEFGIIENINYEFDNSIGEKIIVTGNLGSHILDWRKTEGTTNFSGTAEDSIRKLVVDNFINTTISRKINNLELQPKSNFTEKIDFQCTDKNILEQCTKISKVSNLGFRILADYVGKRFLLDVYKGRDLSDDIVLSDEDGNIKNSKYEEINSTERTYFEVKGEGEGTNRKKVVIDDGAVGWNRREILIDARDLQQGNLSLLEYEKTLLNRGLEKKTEYVSRKNFDATISLSDNAIYKQDWDLGDIITVRKESWGIEIKERVTEVEEIYSQGKIEIYPTFGTPLPELKEILKEEI